jgi:hypothetical protein
MEQSVRELVHNGELAKVRGICVAPEFATKLRQPSRPLDPNLCHQQRKINETSCVESMSSTNMGVSSRRTSQGMYFCWVVFGSSRCESFPSFPTSPSPPRSTTLAFPEFTAHTLVQRSLSYFLKSPRPRKQGRLSLTASSRNCA